MTNLNQLQEIENRTELLAEIIELSGTREDLSLLQERSDAEIANVLESVTVSIRHAIIESLPPHKYWSILALLQFETARNIHTSLTEEFAQQRLACISDTDVIAFSDFLPQDFVDEYLLSQSAETVAHVQQALSYDDEKVGRFAEPYFLVANAKNSVGRVKSELQKRADNPVKLVIVRDVSGIIGTIGPEAMLLNDDSVKLKAISIQTPILEDTQALEDVCQQTAIDGSSMWLPVLSMGKVMGILPMTTVALTLRELSLQAVVQESGKSEEDLFTPLKVAARLRALWLVINLMTAFAASAVIGVFEGVVEQVVALAILMPVVASMGGIAGSQTLAVSLRGIALNHLHTSNLGLLVSKELKIAAINGVVMGAAIGAIVYFVFGSVPLALIICCAIGVNSLAAAASGTLIPFTLKKFNIDPAVAGSVVLTTVTDVVGFLVFLGLGALFLV
jgi:Mg/Co/Ni transporter MgtE